MVDSGLRARLTCVDPRVLDRRLAGREFDDTSRRTAGQCRSVRRAGEFTPSRTTVRCSRTPFQSSGEIVERDGFVFADLLPSNHRDQMTEMTEHPNRIVCLSRKKQPRRSISSAKATASSEYRDTVRPPGALEAEGVGLHQRALRQD
jgi:hypothetical protein